MTWDAKVFMYGRVVNKLARHNLCFAEVAQEPDYQSKRGRVVEWASVPLTQQLHTELERITGARMIGEGNRYYDVKKCGIGYHGDTERRVVVGVRLGASMSLHFNWHHNTKPVGEHYSVVLDHGDIYLMSEKAVGFDWKKRSQLTLRHAAGCAKFTTIRE